MLGLPLALCSSLCWGVSDFVGGMQARAVPVLRVLLISESFALGCVGVILVIRGSGPPAFAHLWPALAAGVAGTGTGDEIPRPVMNENRGHMYELISALNKYKKEAKAGSIN